jgi:hypothetical protein
MTPDPTRIRRYITEFTFKPLFVEELGWDDLRSAPLTVTVAGQHFTLRGVAEKRGLVLLQCDALPPYPVRRQIDREVTKYHREHLIVFAAADQAAQVWLWVRREPGKPARAASATTTGARAANGWRRPWPGWPSRWKKKASSPCSQGWAACAPPSTWNA